MRALHPRPSPCLYARGSAPMTTRSSMSAALLLATAVPGGPPMQAGNHRSCSCLTVGLCYHHITVSAAHLSILRRGAGAHTSSRDAIRKRSTLGSAVLMKPSSKDACAPGSAGWRE